MQIELATSAVTQGFPQFPEDAHTARRVQGSFHAWGKH